MKKVVVVGGCLFAIIILIVASVPVYANPQTTITIKNIINSNLGDGSNFLNYHKLHTLGWLPGDLIGILISLLFYLFIWWVKIIN